MTVIIDYNMGNLGSIKNMLKKVGEPSEISADPQVISSAKRLILPGVGAFYKGMEQLHQLKLIEPIREAVLDKKIPTLGICLGMQLLTTHSEEGNVEGFNFIPAKTKKFSFEDPKLKVPHIGWNTINVQQDSPYFDRSEEEIRFYFVHSFSVHCESRENALAMTHYGYDFDSSIKKDHILGCQFHPEKSHRFGIEFFKKWLLNTEPPT